IRDTAPVATIDELTKALESFHRQSLLIPSLCPEGVWEVGRARHYVPGPQPERSIQKELVKAINYWFRGVVKAGTEDKTDIGRIDVRLLQSQGNQPLAYWAIIELKVVKSRVNAPRGVDPASVPDGVNVDAVVEGLTQAFAYRQNRKAEEGLLE